MEPLNKWEWLSMAWFALSLVIFAWGWRFTSHEKRRLKERAGR